MSLEVELAGKVEDLTRRNERLTAALQHLLDSNIATNEEGRVAVLEARRILREGV